MLNIFNQRGCFYWSFWAKIFCGEYLTIQRSGSKQCNDIHQQVRAGQKNLKSSTGPSGQKIWNFRYVRDGQKMWNFRQLRGWAKNVKFSTAWDGQEKVKFSIGLGWQNNLKFSTGLGWLRWISLHYSPTPKWLIVLAHTTRKQNIFITICIQPLQYIVVNRTIFIRFR